jgi:hypothetical protein
LGFCFVVLGGLARACNAFHYLLVISSFSHAYLEDLHPNAISGRKYGLPLLPTERPNRGLRITISP